MCTISYFTKKIYILPNEKYMKLALYIVYSFIGFFNFIYTLNNYLIFARIYHPICIFSAGCIGSVSGHFSSRRSSHLSRLSEPAKSAGDGQIAVADIGCWSAVRPERACHCLHQKPARRTAACFGRQNTRGEL